MKSKICLLAFVFSVLGIGTVLALPDENRPEYQKEYDAYLKDLDVIARTGKAPKNPDLEADLAKMSSNDKILLTALRQEVTNEMILAQSDQAQIVNSVEIIRVPEEFQQDYAEVYKEEKKTISAQSLIEDQNQTDKRDFMGQNEQYENPFRSLPEVGLSSSEKAKDQKVNARDPIVDAYFSQFGRPYSDDNSSFEGKVVTKSATVQRAVSVPSESESSDPDFSVPKFTDTKPTDSKSTVSKFTISRSTDSKSSDSKSSDSGPLISGSSSGLGLRKSMFVD